MRSEAGPHAQKLQIPVGFCPQIFLFSTEVNVKKVQLSPVTSLLVSLTLVAGILVAGLTNGRLIPAVKAGGGAPGVSSLAAQNGTLSAGLISASGVVIGGVPTDGIFDGQIEIGNTLVESRCGIDTSGGVFILGAYPSGNAPSLTGAYPSGN